MIRFLSFGGGMQSTAILRMSLDGHLPELHHVIFADTGAEWPETYENVKTCEAACQNRGVAFHTVRCHYRRSTGDLFSDLEGSSSSSRWASPPLFLDNSDRGMPPGQTRRQCTGDFKKDPILRAIRDILEISPGSRGPKEIVAEQWLGIDLREIIRMKTADQRWYRILHPLIELVPGGMDRADCVRWLRDHGYPTPPKSACVFCPYQSGRRWQQLRHSHPGLFERCVRLDSHVRDVSQFNGVPYFHPALKPLDVAVRDLERQGRLWDNDSFSAECSGFCGV